MKNLLALIVLIISINSCQINSNFNETGIFYKGLDADRDLYLTFINDTIVAINSDSLKACAWSFLKFEYNEKGLFRTNELKTDTIWFKPKDRSVQMNENNDSLIFNTVELTKSKIDKLKKDIEISQNFSDKGILYECEYTIKEVGYFYERAVNQVKNKLKNPSSAKFNEAYIHKHKWFTEDDEFEKSTTTLVSIDVEAKNGFGNFTESKYYVFFFPKADDKTKYDIEFSDTPVLDYEMKKKLKFESND